jgi:hypothetical protein
MTQIAEEFYVVTTGAARAGDGLLDIRLATGRGQLLAGRGRAGFADAVGIAALRLTLVPFDDTAIDAEFDFCVVDGARSLRARLAVRLPGLPRDLARRLADAACRTSPQDSDVDLVEV